MRRVLVVGLVLALASSILAGCGFGPPSPPPEKGACRELTQHDLTLANNDSPVVDCSKQHTAETYLVGTFPASLDNYDINDPALGSYVHDVCQTGFLTYTGASNSLSLRTLLTWVWFRPTTSDWKKGARWFRCDVVGGGAQSTQLLDLPLTVRGILIGNPDDAWMACAKGDSIDGSVKVPCSSDHNWRAVSTVVLGGVDDPYPGDAEVIQKTSQFCHDSVSAWLGYPAEFDFGYTWFDQNKWDAGNRRSVCWAMTNL